MSGQICTTMAPHVYFDRVQDVALQCIQRLAANGSRCLVGSSSQCSKAGHPLGAEIGGSAAPCGALKAAKSQLQHRRSMKACNRGREHHWHHSTLANENKEGHACRRMKEAGAPYLMSARAMHNSHAHSVAAAATVRLAL